MKKSYGKKQKKFLIDPQFDDKLFQIKELINKSRNPEEVKIVSDSDLIESVLILFIDLGPEYFERALEYRDYVLALEMVDQLKELQADGVPDLVKKALDEREDRKE